MRLLVSVRSAAEAAAALEGGAHIIDAKEPSRGSLGPVSAPVLREIADQVPEEIPLSVALGDLAAAAQASDILGELDLEPRTGGTFLKVGFAAGSSEEVIRDLLGDAVNAAASLRCGPRLVAVSYADHACAGVPPPGAVSRLAIGAGASGLLLDTATKDGTGLLTWMTPQALALWVAQARHSGLLTALAGSLDIHSLDPALAARPDVIGVRGAACSGGRNGVVEISRVRRLVEALAAPGLAKRHVPPSAEAVTGPSNYRQQTG
jgi:uncharacterized protein (UPF0264 family)